MPLQLTSFIGREQAIAELATRLPRIRLLTLTGPGGSGKSRLALQVAAESLDAWDDGVWLVELSASADPALVPIAVAAVFRVREERGRQLIGGQLRPVAPGTGLRGHAARLHCPGAHEIGQAACHQRRAKSSRGVLHGPDRRAGAAVSTFSLTPRGPLSLACGVKKIRIASRGQSFVLVDQPTETISTDDPQPGRWRRADRLPP